MKDLAGLIVTIFLVSFIFLLAICAEFGAIEKYLGKEPKNGCCKIVDEQNT